MSDEPLPPPPVPADCDLRSFGFMPLDVQRLLTSEWWIKALEEQPEACGAAVNLWSTAWHQVPAASLPDNDTVLRRMSGVDRETWERVRARVMEPWRKCSDGLLYHPVVAEKALEAWEHKRTQSERGKRGNEARWGAKDRGRIAEGSPPDRTAIQDDRAPIAEGSHRDPQGSQRQERTGEDKTREDSAAHARASQPVNSEALAIIAEFDRALVAAHGENRARIAPQAADGVIAQRWVDQGLTAALLAPLFAARHQARAAAGQEPIGGLRYLEGAVRDLGSAPRPGPSTPPANGKRHPAAELDRRYAAWKAALEAAKARGDTKIPAPSSFGFRANIETGELSLLPGDMPELPPPKGAPAPEPTASAA